jgi:hypothetical protein
MPQQLIEVRNTNELTVNEPDFRCDMFTLYSYLVLDWNAIML